MSAYDELYSHLKEWKVETEESAGRLHGFNRSVWSRIEAAESRRVGSIVSWIQNFATPRMAVASLAIALVCGIMIGGLQARSTQEERYLLSLKPFAGFVTSL